MRVWLVGGRLPAIAYSVACSADAVKRWSGWLGACLVGRAVAFCLMGRASPKASRSRPHSAGLLEEETSTYFTWARREDSFGDRPPRAGPTVGEDLLKKRKKKLWEKKDLQRSII